MYIFGVDTPLVEIFFVMSLIMVLFFVLLIVAVFYIVRLNRKLDGLSRNELVELERLKKLEDELHKVIEEERDELAFFDHMRKDLGHAISAEEKNLAQIQSLKKEELTELDAVKRMATRPVRTVVRAKRPAKHGSHKRHVEHKKHITHKSSKTLVSNKKRGGSTRPVRVTFEVQPK